MQKPSFILLAAISGFVAVTLGAFGAHALKATLHPDLYPVYQTAVEYQFYHTFPLLFLGLASDQLPGKWVKCAGIAFVVGIILFSGSLYALALSGVKALGMITPLGGVAFLLGWGILIYAALHRCRK